MKSSDIWFDDYGQRSSVASMILLYVYSLRVLFGVDLEHVSACVWMNPGDVES